MRRWELPAALVCAALTFLPWGPVRIPAAILLLCLIPGMAIARHWLGESSIPRRMILGSLLSLCGVTMVAIPSALIAGRPSPAIAAAAACLVTLAATVGRRRRSDPADAPLPPLRGRHLVFLAAAALLLQVLFSAAMHPEDGTIRWRGLPDLIFFQGIYTQICLHTPPLDPENGGSLLVHNWIYHFHFALLHLLTGLPVAAVQRIASAWMALVLLGVVYLIAADLLRRPAAGLVAGLLLMTGGGVDWFARPLLQRLDVEVPGPWNLTPFSVSILSGWYNLAPLAAGLAAWYWLERHRASAASRHLAASLLMCVALAFFHPIFYGVFMIGFCLYLGRLWMKEGRRPGWLLYLATPLPFFLLYKIPYYGLAMPPKVVDLDPSPYGLASRALYLLLFGGFPLALGAVGLLGERGRLGLIPWLAGSSVLLHLALRSPNPHWFRDYLYIALAVATGAGVEWLRRRSRLVAAAALTAALAAGTATLALAIETALRLPHVYTGGERAAAAWLRSNTGADDLLAVVPNSPSTYTVIGLAHRRVIHGWTTHLLDFHPDARQQAEEVLELFQTSDPERAAEIARRYGARYVYVGSHERQQTSRGALGGPCFDRVFALGEVEVYRFDCTEEPEPRADPPPTGSNET